MAGSLTETISGTAVVSGATVNFSLSFTVAVADAATAQTISTGIKAFLAGGGATIVSVQGAFSPSSTAVA